MATYMSLRLENISSFFMLAHEPAAMDDATTELLLEALFIISVNLRFRSLILNFFFVFFFLVT